MASRAAGAALSAAEKLSRLRSLLKTHNWHAYVIPSADAHASEYVSDRDKRRQFLSAFSGSAGTAVVTLDDARLWTDGRYFLQANQQLDASAGWSLMRDREKETPSIEEWLSKALKPGDTVAIDPSVFNVATVNRFKHKLYPSGIHLFTGSHTNLVDQVWGEEQPGRPQKPVMALPVKYTGLSMAEKLEKLRGALKEAGATALLLTALDEIAWTFNIRGSDVECNPVTYAYAVLPLEGKATLFIDESKVSEEVKSHLQLGELVQLAPYDSVEGHLSKLAAEPGSKVWLDSSNCNFALYQALQQGIAAAKEKKDATAEASAGSGAAGAAAGASSSSPSSLLEKMSPVQLLKSVKNGTEIAGIKAAHVRDGVALTTFFAWLEHALKTGEDKRTGKPLDFALTECTVSEVLAGFRAAEADFMGLSFETIAGMGPNGAIIHYKPEPSTAAKMHAEGVFLCDSGGQYRDGTTDVTRTLHFGTPSEHEKHCYTRVLQGHIAMSAAIFPPGTQGFSLDSFARYPLWQSGLDYRHGTGHGVGCFLNVHEGPQGASFVRGAYEGGIQEGMTLTDEPGYYEDGAFGIRIENVLIAKKAQTLHNFGGKGYLCFEPVTMAPITTRLLQAELLSPQEKKWLNDYNAAVRKTLEATGRLPEYVRDYLQRETEPVA